MMTDYQITKESFDLWLTEGSEGNKERLQQLKRMLPVALKECCTETKRIYITHYFVDGMKIQEIAELYGVYKSTVSRTIRRALRRMYDHLRFCSPELCKVPQKQWRLTQKAGRKKRAYNHSKNSGGGEDSYVSV